MATGAKKNTGHVFAIKTYKIARTDEQHRRLLDKEVLALKTVDHPNICRLFETYEDRFDVHLVYVTRATGVPTNVASHAALLTRWTRHATPTNQCG